MGALPETRKQRPRQKKHGEGNRDEDVAAFLRLQSFGEEAEKLVKNPRGCQNAASQQCDAHVD